MTIATIKQELAARGVDSRGLFEKVEFVELLVEARQQNARKDERRH